MSGEQQTNEFVDARPSEEEEVPPPASGEDDDHGMVFLDEAVEAPAARKGPPKAAPKSPPKAPSASGAVARPGPSQSGSGPRPAPAPSASGTARPPSGVSGAAARPPSGPAPKQPPARPSPTSGTQRPPSGPLPRQASPADDKRLAASSSGRFKALSASSTNATAASPSSSSRLQRPALRPERSRDEDNQAISALEARLKPAPTGDPFVGKDVGPFRVEAFVEVDRGERRYAAVQTETQRVVLLRLFPLAGAFGEEFKRVAERAERACRVESPNLDVAVAAGRTKDAFFVGVDPPLGPTLAELLVNGPLEEADVLALVEQAGRGLGALHSRDMAHGHVSPDVFRRLRPGTWVVEAAGLARPRPSLSFLAAGGDVLGRPGFIAPETVDGGESTRSADLYSLGCVAWASLCGRAPFVGDDEVQVLLDQLNHEVPALALPPGRVVTEPVQTVVKKLTGYTPDTRYKDAKDLVADLRARERGEALAPFQAVARTDDARPAKKLQGSGTPTIVLLVVNVVLLMVIAATAFKAMRMEFADPVEGFELPLPAGRSPGR